ncbi:4'-phosphopantetheinyl transferase superfamily protein [Streptomyces sp. NPDC041068]|uniref:4'-phosphopantetheinyl transferase family protein n=1 Tax=Streptomyces sp. NPDC041068 TaxID=3155130 RepID=UPI0033F13A4D
MTALQLEVAPGVWVALHTADPPPGPLTAADVAVAERLPPWRARELLAGRRVLRALLAARFPEAADAPIRYRPGGRPVLAGRPRLGISVSHDRDATAACAGLDRAVGVDVQYAPERVRPSLLRRCAHDRAEELARLPAERRGAEFAWLWTVQEACAKAEGSGLAGRPWRIAVPPGRRAGSWGRYTWACLRDHSPLPCSVAYDTPAPAPVPAQHPEQP